MSLWRRAICALLCLLLLPGLSGCAPGGVSQPTIALMPLDSRPCNTQYPSLLAEAATATLLLPAEEDLDHFLSPADQAALWTWLEEAADEADHLVIFTNSLFCGSLIASRGSGAYDNIDSDLARLQKVCAAFKSDGAHSVTVIQILPRLTPTQYDAALYPYADLLSDYGRAWNEADAAGQTRAAEAEGVPAASLAEYVALHEKSAELALALNALAADGLIDQLIISQDDGDAYCPANITFRQLAEVQAANTALLHGADELGMLLVANLLTSDMNQTPVRLRYSSDESRSTYYPYESIPLYEMTTQKLALANLTANDEATTTLYLHAATGDLAETEAVVAEHSGVLALADVATTNHQDPALDDLLFADDALETIDLYAGWNTAGNSIGTVCAELRIRAWLDAHWEALSAAEQEAAVRALYTFRAIRYAEDCCYMGDIRSQILATLQADGRCDENGLFASEAVWPQADALLTAAYAPYNDQLAALFNGDHTLHLGSRSVDLTISDFSSALTYPWARAFEVAADVEMTISLHE